MRTQLTSRTLVKEPTATRHCSTETGMMRSMCLCMEIHKKYKSVLCMVSMHMTDVQTQTTNTCTELLLYSATV